MRTSFANAGRFALGLLLTAGLVAGGLVLSGSSARALSYVRGPASARLPGLDAMRGSNVLGVLGSSRQVAVNERDVRVLDCLTDRAPKAVLEHYEQVAKAELRADAPYLRQDGPDRWGLLWATPDRISKAVLVWPGPNGRGARYRLIVDESRQPLGLVRGTRALVGGIAPASLTGCEIGHSVCAEDGSGLLLLHAAREDARGFAGRLLEVLEERGFRCDRATLRAYEGRGELVIPLRHDTGGLRGVLKVTPEERLGARAFLSLHPEA
ncbi:MAG: hypothetical protein AB7N76_15385 [Planctomycetota bacterium]